ncbi:MAG TPA: radical SAM family heme chaperone HemW [Oculatellaceae cyanobacterium]|jgi:oxygen-independent coproporphyrinogen-3 oxidase
MPVHQLLNNLQKYQLSRDTGIPKSAYLHIPFCRRRCYYCDFPVSVVGNKTGENSGTIQQYIDVLSQEISITPKLGYPLETIFFGGGTPSLLSVEQLKHLLDVLNKQFGIAANAEISMEIDPGTFNYQQIKGYLDAGVNRISMGVQAFQDELLQICGRSHNVSDIYASIEIIRTAAVPNFSIDLISGLPHQTLAQWQTSLETAVAIAPNHISIYDLIIESVTAFGRQYHPGDKPLPTDETAANMYRLAQQVLTSSGYQHYEISNYSQPDYHCRHNRVYWENRPYYAFGMGASSYVDGCRFTRPRKTREYYEWVQQLTQNKGTFECPQISENEVLLETLMLGLRMAEGLSLQNLAEQFGTQTLKQIWDCLQDYYKQGWVEVLGENYCSTKLGKIIFNPQLPTSGRIRLSDPEGFLFSNTILATLFSKLGED